MNDHEEPSAIQRIEDAVRQIPWEEVTLEPLIDVVEELDDLLPEIWTQTLEYVQIQEIERETLEPLYTMSDAELEAAMREALRELEVDLTTIMHEVDTLDHTHEQDRSPDFGR